MATTLKTKMAKSKTRAATTSTTDASATDAISLLKSDHRTVDAYFRDYEDLTDPADKKALAIKICTALTVHTQIEEELFYPAARKATRDNDLLDEATVEHAGAKNLIAEIDCMQPGQPLYDAKIKVLGEQVRHHVEEEEEELFPEVEATKLDLEALGVKLAARKSEILAQLGPKLVPA